jgi:hypothetical protein
MQRCNVSVGTSIWLRAGARCVGRTERLGFAQAEDLSALWIDFNYFLPHFIGSRYKELSIEIDLAGCLNDIPEIGPLNPSEK